MRSSSAITSTASADARQAMVLGEQLGDDRIVGRAGATLGFVTSITSDPFLGVELLTAAAERCHAVHDLYGETEARVNLAQATLSSEDTRHGRALLADARTVAARCGSHILLALADCWAAMFATTQGDFGGALADADHSEAMLCALAGHARVGNVGGLIIIVRAIVAVATGDRRQLDGLDGFMSDAWIDVSPLVERALTVVQALDRAGRGDLDGARTLLDPILGASGAVTAVGVAADVARAMGDLAGAGRLLDDAENSARHSSPIQHFCNTTLSRAALGLAAGELARSEELAHRELTVAHAQGFRIELVVCFELMANIAAANYSWGHAARLHGAAQRLRTDMGMTLRLPGYADEHDRAMAATEKALGPESHAAAVAEGAGLDLDAAVAYAQRSRGERKRPGFGWQSLTPAELDVVKLAAAGLTNPQIGQRLLISRETVKTHLAHIFAKLGVRNRAELTALSIEQNHVAPEP